MNYSTWSPTDRYHIFCGILRDVNKDRDGKVGVMRARTPKILTVYVGHKNWLKDTEIDLLTKYADIRDSGIGYFHWKFHFHGVKPGRIKPSEEVKKEIKIITTLRRLDRQ